MLALAAALAFQAPTNLPENPSVDYSGIPIVRGGNVSLVSHSATLELYSDHALVSSVTQVRNLGGVGKVTVTIPRYRLGDAKSGVPAFPVTASWANVPISLVGEGYSKFGPSGSAMTYSSSVGGLASMKAGGSYALRVNYRVPLGRAGFDRKQLLAAYDLAGSAPVGTVNVTYKYAKGVVFRLPEPKPDLGWQIGDRGAFLRLGNYDNSAGLTYLIFYPGGFKNIGGG